MSRTLFPILGAAALFLGCADYRYQAHTPVSALATDHEAGRVAVRSSGFGTLPGGGGRALQVVLSVSNDSAQPWQLDPARQRIVLPDGSERAPVAAVAGGVAIEGPLAVPPGRTRSVDLYYPPPPGEAQAKRLPEYAARWQVDTGAGAERGETTFTRVNVAGPTLPCGVHASAYCLAGYGP